MCVSVCVCVSLSFKTIRSVQGRRVFDPSTHPPPPRTPLPQKSRACTTRAALKRAWAHCSCCRGTKPPSSQPSTKYHEIACSVGGMPPGSVGTDCCDALVEARAVIYHARKYDGLVVGLHPVDAGTLRKSTSRHRATGKAAPRVSCQCATALSVYIAYPKRSM